MWFSLLAVHLRAQVRLFRPRVVITITATTVQGIGAVGGQQQLDTTTRAPQGSTRGRRNRTFYDPRQLTHR